MYAYEHLEYPSVFKYFKEICAIPHGSGNTKQLSDYCVDFARQNGLQYRRDSLGNVLIKKPATSGYDNHPPVLLQGHLDMVCEKATGSSFDFLKDGLCVDMQGDSIFAHGTTLGGDDGVAIALCLALLTQEEIAHPPLEILFTVDEETGMFGAEGLDCSDILSKQMINIDSEEEGVFTVSCAGGACSYIEIPLESEPLDAQMLCYKITICGLLGGHSGVEIDKGRLNANVVAAQFLKEIGACRVISVSGGQKDNTIPLRAEILLATQTDVYSLVEPFINKTILPTDPGLKIEIEPILGQTQGYTVASSAKIASFLTEVPNGIIAMSQDIDGLVQTSLNLGILKTKNGYLTASFAVRSSINAEKHTLLEQLQRVANQYGGTAEHSAFYPAWEFRKNSPLQNAMCSVWTECFNTAPKIAAIHAGLECGFFCEKLPGLDAVSIGPNMQDIHTCRERLSISSTQRIYKILLALLKKL